MSAPSISAVYLSGWEYNRLLQSDPTQPRNSALPASILWNGAHQLWMFEKLYCTKESFDNEVKATDRLGWVNGHILRDLAKEQILETVDWCTLPTETKDALQTARDTILPVITADRIRTAIQTGDAGTLELAKAAILEPVLRTKNCLESGAPNSIRTWVTNPALIVDPQTDHRLAGLAHAVVPGFQACRAPGAGLSNYHKNRQRRVQHEVEAPMIPDLLAGDGEFAGDMGFEPYFDRLMPVRDAYEEINAQLRHDWGRRRQALLDLRGLAQQYVWSDLHSYWLPRLKSKDQYQADRARVDFETWIRSAMRIKSIAPLLNSKPVKVWIGALGSSALTATLTKLGVPLPEAVLSASGATVGAYLSTQPIKDQFDRVARLGVFYQQAIDL